MKTIQFFILFILSTISFGQEEFYDNSFGNAGQVSYNLNQQGLCGKLLKHQNSLYGLFFGVETQNHLIVKYDLEGNVDNSFNNNNGVVVFNLMTSSWSYTDHFQGYLGITNDDKIIAATLSAGPSDELPYNIMTKLNLDGSLDQTFGTNGYVSSVFDQHVGLLEVKILENGDIIIIGKETVNLEQTPNIVIVKFTSDGQLITEFGTNGIVKFVTSHGNLPIQSFYVEDENLLYIGGREFINRYNLNTLALDSQFAISSNSYNYQFYVTNNGELFVSYVDLSYNNSFLVKYNNQQVVDINFGNQGVVSVVESSPLHLRKLHFYNNYFYVFGEIDEHTQFIKRYNLDGEIDLGLGVQGTLTRVNSINGNGAMIWNYDILMEGNTITTSGSCLLEVNSNLVPCIHQFIDPTLSIDEINYKNVTLYPNPTSKYLTITHENLIDKIEIYNALGQLVLIQYDLFTNIVDVSELEQGIYQIKVFDTSKNIYMEKFVKND